VNTRTVRTRWMAFALLTIATASMAGCDGAPGGRVEAAYVAPDKVLDFAVLYRSNCAGCHGVDGRGGAALALANPMYLAFAGDDAIRRATAEGVRGTPMPAFARRAGGTLTDAQVEVVVKGMRERWAKPDVAAGGELPPYAQESPGDARRGGVLFASGCAQCHRERGHRERGHGGKGDGDRHEGPGDRFQASKASAIVDGSYLALVSDQGLRTTVIAGRPDLGAPDFRGNLPGRTMTTRDVADVVAWLAAQRPAASHTTRLR